MRRLIVFSMLLGSVLITKSAHINSTNVNNTVNETEMLENETISNETAIIEVLRKEKEDLYNKINQAIDEAIPELEKTNDSDASIGLQHLKTLKEQIKQIHEAESDEANDLNGNSTNADYRRKVPVLSAGRQGRDWFSRQKAQKDEFYQKLMKNRNAMYTSAPKILNRQKISQQIEQWLLKKAEEKQKRKELDLEVKLRNERCPYFGRGKRKKKSTFGKGKGRRPSMKTYPCCRKCCKNSYIGCL